MPKLRIKIIHRTSYGETKVYFTPEFQFGDAETVLKLENALNLTNAPLRFHVEEITDVQ